MKSLELNRFINKNHLSSGATIEICNKFFRHKINFVQIPDFLTPKMADSCSTFLKREAMYSTVYGLYSRKNHIVDKESWLKSQKRDQFYRYQMLSSSKSVSSDSINYLKIRKFFDSELFKEYINNITGAQVDSSSSLLVHKMRIGDFLKKHNDRSNNRKIAFILYLSPNWSAEFGGQLHIEDYDSTQTVITPTYNSLVLFDVNKHKSHFVSPLVGSSSNNLLQHNQERISINGWFI